MNETTDAVPVFSPQPPKTSRLAIASFVMALLCLLTCVLWPILALPAIVCGIIGLVKISKSNGRLKGNGLAITGLVIPGVMLLVMPMTMAILMPALSRARLVARQVICSTNLKGLGAALEMVTGDYEGKLPVGENWCDILITKADVSPRSLICPSAHDIEGECSYAMNIHAAGKQIDRLPPNMVLLFETDAGSESGTRTYATQNRLYFQVFADHSNEYVYQYRWNQVGGPEILTTDNHGGKGCNILFVDGSAAFIRAEEIGNLRWTP